LSLNRLISKDIERLTMQEQGNTFIIQQANDWLVKLETGDMLAGDEERFVAWLEQDERHGEAFYQAEQAWQLMHQAEQGQPDKSIPETNLSQMKASWFKRHIMPIAAVVLLSFVSMFWWQNVYFSLFSDYYTLTGQRLEQSLPDGSVLTLNTDSAIDIRFDQNTRLIEVLSGEVYVEVAPNQPRPFVVKAGSMKVTALGTAFIVKHAAKQEPIVTVTEHSVRVESTKSVETQLVLKEGQQVALLQKGERLTSIKNVNGTLAKAWTKGKYVFQDKTFETVIAELNRYYDGKMIIRDNSLGKQLISGVLDLDKPLESLENLILPLRAKTTKITPYVILINKS